MIFFSVLRFGKCVDSLYSVASTFHNPDLFIRVTLTLSKVTNSLFLFADHLIWLARSGFLKNIDSNKWTELSNRYWLLTILLNLARDLYEIQRILFNEKDFIFGNTVGKKNVNNYLYILCKAFSVFKVRKDVVIDTVKNFCDLWIPLTALGRVQLHPRTVGLLGAVSSLAGLIALSQPSAKLVPS